MKPELLAPAGSPASLRAAVEAGADAVYMGAGWNARVRARNFTLEELGKAMAYCQANGVKAYVALNILVFQSELGRVAGYISKVYEQGADALIVQDLGVASIAREIAPDLPLHASTQLSTHNSKTARRLKELGFERLILARELTLTQAVRIKREAGVEVEMFCHGALCYSYSGKCFFSFAQTGRSANRGACAQICRFPWKLYVDGHYAKSGYLTSTKDLNTIHEVPRIAHAGIDCLKIEGRLKDGAYVRAVVSAYRKAIDHGQTPDLSALTSRGYTRGYVFNDARKRKLTNPAPHAFLGQPVGRVRSAGGRGAQVELTAPLAVGDCIRSSSSGKIIELFRLYQKGREVKRASGSCTLLIKTLKPGETLFKTARAQIEDSVLDKFGPAAIRKARLFTPDLSPMSYAPFPSLCYVQSPDEAARAADSQAAVLPLEDWSDELPAREAGYVLDTPRVAFDDELPAIEKRMRTAAESARPPRSFMVSELSMLGDYPSILGPYANLTNTHAARAWSKFGNVAQAVASLELASAPARAMGLMPFTGQALELMISENNLFAELEVKGKSVELEDPHKNRFQVVRKNGRTLLLKARHAPR